MTSDTTSTRPLLIYALHSGNLYGTERMALATVQGLSDEFDCVMMAPEGPALTEARRLGFIAVPFESVREFAIALWKLLGPKRRISFFATGVMHSFVCLLLNLVRSRKISHLHLVHGGAEESLSYGRKKKLNGWPVRFVAVSAFVRDRLIANGVAGRQISVVENFLTDERVAAAPHRGPFKQAGVRRLIVISRLDPEKKLDTLLEAFERFSDLKRFTVRVLGRGWNEVQLRERARISNLPIQFEGFEPNVDIQLAASDLLVHLCPTEPFGLAILEAMAAHIPVLTPDSGGASSLVEPGVSGFRFRAGDAQQLAAAILDIDKRSPEEMNLVVRTAARILGTRFSQKERVAEYRSLIEESYA